MEYICTQMESATMANMKMIKKKVTEFTTGPMDASMKDGGTRVNNMGLVLIQIMQKIV